jgi:hypothetical protein
VGKRKMISRQSIFNRSATLTLPLVSFFACAITLLAYGVPLGKAASWPFSSWIRFAFLIELGLGAAFAAGDCLVPNKRRVLSVSAAVLLAVSAILGWVFARGLLF